MQKKRLRPARTAAAAPRSESHHSDPPDALFEVDSTTETRTMHPRSDSPDVARCSVDVLFTLVVVRWSDLDRSIDCLRGWAGLS
jgi:hypothetical protein